MRASASLARAAAAVLLALTGACGRFDAATESASTPERPAAKPAPTAAPHRASPASLVPLAGAVDEHPSAGPDASASAQPGMGGAFLRIPGDALVAVRLPHFRQNAAAWQQTALYRGFERAGFEEATALLDDPIAFAREAIGESIPKEVAEWLEVASGVSGEVVFALLDVDPLLAEIGGECPISAAFFIELGGEAAAAKALLADIATNGGSTRSRPAFARLDGDRYEVGDDDMRMELEIRDGRLAGYVGPGSGPRGRLAALAEIEPEDSFAAAPLVADAPRPAAGATTWAEVYVNYGALLRKSRDQMDRPAREIADACGLEQISGITAVLSLEGENLHDVFAVRSEGRRDALTQLVGSVEVDPMFARYVPAESDSAGLVAFDLQHAFDSIRSRLPAEARRDLDAGILAAEQDLGIDVLGDVLGNLGPQFAYGARGDLVAAILEGHSFEATVAMQVREPARARALLDELVDSGKLPLRPRSAGEVRYHSLSLPLPDAPAWLDLSFGLVGNALVIASSGEAFCRVAEAAGAAAPQCELLSKAVAARGPGAFAVSASATRPEVLALATVLEQGFASIPESGRAAAPFQLPSPSQVSAFAADLGDSVRVWRAGENGVTFDSVGPISSPWLMMAPVSIMSAVAIPKLMVARNNANEAAAIATLRNICSAQAQFQVSCAADRNGNGMGEYGSFGELTGTTPLPSGELLDPPVLSAKLAVAERGCAVRSGYVYKMFLPGTGAVPLAEQSGGGAPEGVDADDAEVYWLAYAWPQDLGSSGSRVFAIDQEGDIYYAFAHELSPPCSGPEHPPAADAAFTRPGTMRKTDDDLGMVRQAQNAVVWMLLQ